MATEAERNRGLGAYSTPGVEHPVDKSPARIITTSPEVTFQLHNVSPPSSLYITENDFISVICKNLLVGITVIIRTRILRKDGVIQYSDDAFVPATDGSPSTLQIRLTEGYLLGIAFSSTGTNPIRGQTYIECQLGHGNITGGKTFYPLCSNYLLIQNFCGWPGVPFTAAVDGAGNIRDIAGTTPALGAEFNEVVPTNRRWRLQALHNSLNTSATVANRQPRLVIDDGVNVWYTSPALANVTAGTIIQFNWGAGTSAFSGVEGTQNLTVPSPTTLMAGWRLRSSTAGLQAGDAWGAPIYSVEEWVED